MSQIVLLSWRPVRFRFCLQAHGRTYVLCLFLTWRVSRPTICADGVSGSLYDVSCCRKYIVVHLLFFAYIYIYIYIYIFGMWQFVDSQSCCKCVSFLSSPLQPEKDWNFNASDALDRIRCESITDLKERGFFMSGTNSTITSLYGCRSLRTWPTKSMSSSTSVFLSGDVVDTMTLAVCQAQFISAEQTAQATYEQESKENGIEKTTKDQDVRYKTKESLLANEGR